MLLTLVSVRTRFFNLPKNILSLQVSLSAMGLITVARGGQDNRRMQGKTVLQGKQYEKEVKLSAPIKVILRE